MWEKTIWLYINYGKQIMGLDWFIPMAVTILIGVGAVVVIILAARVARQAVNHISRLYLKIDEVNVTRSNKEMQLERRIKELETQIKSVRTKEEKKTDKVYDEGVLYEKEVQDD